MGLSCGLVGLPSCGKTTIFNALTAAGASGYGTEMNKAIVMCRTDALTNLSKCIIPAKPSGRRWKSWTSPGLQTSSAGEGRGSKLLGHIKDVEALLHVVRCFEDGAIPFALKPSTRCATWKRWIWN